jgi:hypothetical protein
MPLLAVLALLAAPAQPPLAPLVEGRPTAKGNTSVTLQLGTQPTVGFSYFTANNVAIRLDVGFAAQLSPGGTPAEFSVDFGVRFYDWKRDRVAVFFQPSVGLARTAFNGGTEQLRFSGGIGVEYFFTDTLSAGGILGLTLALGNLGGTGSTVTTLETATSGVFLNIYF